MAKLGTPENPEIIDPSQPDGARSSRAGGSAGAGGAVGWRARLRLGRQLLFWMASISLPALIFNSLVISLVSAGWASGSLLAWLAVFLLSVPAFIFTLIALLGFIVLLPVLYLALTGRPSGIGNAGGVNFGGFRMGMGGVNMGGFDARVFRRGSGARGPDDNIRSPEHARDVTGDAGSDRIDGFSKK